MGINMRDSMIKVLTALREEPPEATLKRYREDYPDITLQEAIEAKTLFFNMMDAGTQKERDRALKKHHDYIKKIEKRNRLKRA